MPSGPSLWEKPRPPQTALPDSVQAAMRWRRYCNAKESPCVLCAAHLRFPYEVGEFLAGFVALLGRFLPRLGPHGSPRGPFYFRPPATGWSPRDTWPTTPLAPDLRRPKALACQSFCQPDGNRSVASQYTLCCVAIYQYARWHRYSAAARRSSSKGKAANTLVAKSTSVRVSLPKSLFLVSVASSR
jgi:hypothetical protein